MNVGYEKLYNDRAVENGESFDTECLTYLDDHFRDHIIQSLHDCLKEKPSKPVLFVAEKLQELHAKSSRLNTKVTEPQTTPALSSDESQDLYLYYPGGVCTKLMPLASPVRSIERISSDILVVKLTKPTLYDIVATMQYLEVETQMAQHKRRFPYTTTPAAHDEASSTATNKKLLVSPSAFELLLIVEPPAIPSELIFVKGIPYAHTLSSSLQYQYRRGNTAVPFPEKDQSFSEKALELLKSSIHATNAQSLHEVLNFVLGSRNGLDTSAVSNPTPGTPLSCDAAHWSLIELPSVQHDCLEAFDQIDSGIRKIAEACSGAQPAPVLFVSYQEPQASSLTFARVLSAFFPYFERLQLNEMSCIRAESIARVKSYDLKFCLDYWSDVQRRREQRDRIHGTRTEIYGKRFTAASSMKSQSETYNTTLSVGEGILADLIDAASTTADSDNHGSEITDVFLISNRDPAHRTEVALEHTSKSFTQTLESLTGSRSTNTPAQRATTSARGKSARKHFTPRSILEEYDELKNFQKKVLEERKQRRRNEDAMYLSVVKAHQEILATSIQALFRGFRVRGQMSHRDRCGNKEAKANFLEDFRRKHQRLPEKLPPLIQFCLNRLQSMHKDLFANYPAGLTPEPKKATIYVPSRRTIVTSASPCADTTASSKGGDGRGARRKNTKANQSEEIAWEIESESEEWKVETILVPSKRHTQLAPHFNPLDRLVKYYQLAGFDPLSEAIELMSQCTGMGVLQRRAYDKLKTVVLDLMHVAYIELYHRQRLSSVNDHSFSSYVKNYHDEVVAWFSCPHLFSHLTRAVTAFTLPMPPDSYELSTSTLRRSDYTVAQPQPLLVTEETLRYERVLVCEATHEDDGKSRTRYKVPHASGIFPSSPGSEPWVRLASKVYWLPTLASATSIEQLLRHLVHLSIQNTQTPDQTPSDDVEDKGSLSTSEGKIKKGDDIFWCNLCAYPACFVGRHMFVLVPRQSKQDVEGRAAYDEYVMHRKVVPSEVCVTDPGEAPSVELTQPGVDTPSDRTNPPQPAVPAFELPRLSSCFSGSLLAEDAHLKKYLVKVANGPGRVLTYHVPIADETHYHGTQGVREGAQCSLSMRTVKSSPTLQQQFYPLVELIDATVEPERSSVSVQEHTLEFKQRPPSHEEAKSSSRTLEQGVWDVPNVDAPTSGLVVPPDGTSQRKVQSRRATVRTSHEVLCDLAIGLEESHRDRLSYLRPWIPPLAAGYMWLRLYGKFLEAMKERLSAGSIVVLTADVGDHQTIYVASTVMLSVVLGCDAFVPLEGLNTHKRLSTQDTKPFNSRVPFLSEFLNLLSSYFSRAGVLVDESVKMVESILQTLHKANPLSFTLDSIADRIRAAETQASPEVCKRLILSVVQDTEHYCWLVLLSIFSMLSFTKKNSPPFHGVPQTSFELFVHGIPNALQWIYSMDPWIHTPGRCPDSNHLRYSNGLRRWDTDDYVCFAAL